MIMVASSAMLLNMAEAAIAKDGLWTGNDWYDDKTHIGVKNGIPYSKDVKKQHFLKAPETIDGWITEENYKTFDNVKRVIKHMNESDWEYLFPVHNKIYTYKNFLKSVAKFPAFCGETNLAHGDLDISCKRELAGIFAHWGQETGLHDPKYEHEVCENNDDEGGEGDEGDLGRRMLSEEGEGGQCHTEKVEEWRQALYWVQEIRCNPENGQKSGNCDYKQAGW